MEQAHTKSTAINEAIALVVSTYGNSILETSTGWTEVDMVVQMQEPLESDLRETLKADQRLQYSKYLGTPHNPPDESFLDDEAKIVISFPLEVEKRREPEIGIFGMEKKEPHTFLFAIMKYVVEVLFAWVVGMVWTVLFPDSKVEFTGLIGLAVSIIGSIATGYVIFVAFAALTIMFLDMRPRTKEGLLSALCVLYVLIAYFGYSTPNGLTTPLALGVILVNLWFLATRIKPNLFAINGR